ncbi:MAG: hypothetical protein GY941_27045 [Planctomycetes bacterium]|nr:hypothetical protein [Planctomycetota bacterium]
MGISDFLELLNAKYLYDGGKAMALFVASTISPFLLVISIWLRLGSTQLESATSGQGKWGAFFKDLVVWLTLLALYFAIAGFLSDLFNSLYSYFQERGSLGVILSRFVQMISDIDKAGEETDLLSQSLSVLTAPVTFVVWVIYYFSFLLATILIKFLQLAHAICWSFALVWGLVAIPMSITSTFKLLRGWAIFTATALVWPIIHFGGFALFNPIFQHAADIFVTGSGAGLVSMDKAQLYLIMTVVNILGIAIAIAAPFIAMSLVANSGSIAGVVAPFAGAAVAAAGATMAKGVAARNAAGGVAKTAGGDMLRGKNPLSRVSNGMSNIRQSIMGPSSIGGGGGGGMSSDTGSSRKSFNPASTNTNQVGSADNTGQQSSSGSTNNATSNNTGSPNSVARSAAAIASSTPSNIAAPDVGSPAEAGGAENSGTGGDKAKQAKRGAIINQMNKTPSGKS